MHLSKAKDIFPQRNKSVVLLEILLSLMVAQLQLQDKHHNWNIVFRSIDSFLGLPYLKRSFSLASDWKYML
jgi:hypothetical protein